MLMPWKGYNIAKTVKDLRRCDKCNSQVFEHKGFYKYAHHGQCHGCGKFFPMNKFWKLDYMEDYLKGVIKNDNIK